MGMTSFGVIEKLIVGIEMNAGPTHLLLAHPVGHFLRGFILLINATIDGEKAFLLIAREKRNCRSSIQSG